MELWHYILGFTGGLIAGIINAIAGFGSIITLAIYMDIMGLPGTVANGTNRMNILSSASMAAFGFHKSGKLDLRSGKPYIIISLIGALAGVALAVTIDNAQFKSIYKYLLVLLFFVILINPKRWLHEHEELRKINWWVIVPTFLLIGFYGGFIQVGSGIFFLAMLVLVARYDLFKANALKVFIIGTYTIVVLFIFHSRGLVDWQAGASIMVGQGIGSYLSARYVSKMKNAHIWVYRLLILLVLVVLLQVFGIFQLVFK